MKGCIIDDQGMKMFAVTLILMISNSMVSGKQCARNCINCTTFNQCMECKDGFYNGYWYDVSKYAWQSDCEPKCHEGCEKCSSYYNCIRCEPGRCSIGNKQICHSRCNHYNCERCAACDVCVSCKRWNYGKTCESRCENGCKDICDMDSGYCNCHANFKGPRCSECIDGKYGPYCKRDCPANCAGNSCDRETGLCLNRCTGNDGRCNECPEGKYGLNCESDCPAGCLENKCDKETGSCTNGCENGFKASCTECKDGFYGERCQACPENCLTCHSAENCTECRQGFRGQTCKQSCPHQCVKCDTTGLCIKCHTGYYGETCSVECPGKCAGRLCRKEDGYCESCQSGWWGSQCNHNCSPGCKYKTCDKEGTCEMGCTNNFIGYKCDRCSEGHYGTSCFKCPSGCTQCVSNNTCTKCQKGRYGNTCQSVCPPGCVNGQCYADGSCIACNEAYFGERCDLTCSSNCKGNCIRTTGQCRSCSDGFYGDNCSETCPSNCLKCSSKTGCTVCRTGYKGHSCSDECSNCKKGTDCQQSDGICYHACADGLTGTSCNESCPQVCKTCDRKNKKCTSCLHGKYGVRVIGRSKYISCHLNCSDACVDHACNERSGRCTVDCNKGHWGVKCDKSCSEKCKLNTCNRTTGYCIDGCKKGFFDTKCEHECPKHCTNGICDYTYGTCTEGCVTGFYGSQCSDRCDHQDRTCLECIGEGNYRYKGCTKCKHGFYVTNESKCIECPKWCEGGDCRLATGACEHGCQEGRWGVKCEEHCSVYCSTCKQTDGRCLTCVGGRYGQDCLNECSADCAGDCNNVTGECTSGCKENDKYGKYCERECGLNCLSGRCDWSSGVCSDGCEQGFHGDMCEGMCSNNCRNISCSGPKGECIMGCKDGYEGELCSEAISGSDMNDVIAAGCAVIAGLIIIGILAAILYHRHQKRREPDTGDNQLPVPGHISPPAPQDGAVRPPASTGDTVYANIDATRDDLSVAIEIVEEYENELTGSLPVVPTNTQAPIHPSLQDGENTYYNVDDLLERKVALGKLREFVSNKSEVDFLTEFKDLPVGLIKPYSESQKSDNRAKNRYRGVYPYDTNRVVVKSSLEDYINASYIQGYKTRNAYIASIGPTTKHMGKDFAIFWEMVWQEKVTRIVMLTNLTEFGVLKCAQYWPDVGSERICGNVSVKCEQENDKTHFKIRTFIVKEGDEARTLCQYHFTSWPDKGFPDSVNLLTEFHKESRENRVDLGLEAPLIVHCSAGVGRTGTFIALDILTNEGRVEGHVDIYACVRNLREERVNMVQTLEQYKYLHDCLVETIAT